MMRLLASSAVLLQLAPASSAAAAAAAAGCASVCRRRGPGPGAQLARARWVDARVEGQPRDAVDARGRVAAARGLERGRVVIVEQPQHQHLARRLRAVAVCRLVRAERVEQHVQPAE